MEKNNLSLKKYASTFAVQLVSFPRKKIVRLKAFTPNSEHDHILDVLEANILSKLHT